MTSPPGGLKWECLDTPRLVRGEILGAMDGMLLADRTGLASRSRASDCPGNIVQCPQFRKEAKLISPPVFAPMPSLQKPDETLAQSEMSGKVTWSKATSVIPWPVAQERAFGRALETGGS